MDEPEEPCSLSNDGGAHSCGYDEACDEAVVLVYVVQNDSPY